MTSLLAAALFAGATSAQCQPLTVLPTVGPDSGPKPAVSGYLVVYTDTESPINTGDLQYYPHTAYKIYDSHGTLLRFVRNHLSERDEKPPGGACRRAVIPWSADPKPKAKWPCPSLSAPSGPRW